MARSPMSELEKVRRFIYSCRKCGVCRYRMTGKVPYVCPVKKASPGFENFSSRGKIMLAQALLDLGQAALQVGRDAGEVASDIHGTLQLHVVPVLDQHGRLRPILQAKLDLVVDVDDLGYQHGEVVLRAVCVRMCVCVHGRA